MRKGRLSTFGANVSPQRLPANEYVPVRWNVFGKISTRDGTHPSALREVELDIDKDVRLNAKGYPTCGRREIEGRDTKAAMKACGDSVLGGGIAHVEFAFPEQKPLPVVNPITVFNGGERRGEVR